ncbi:MAG: ParA family protein [Pseudomonadota bacterium]
MAVAVAVVSTKGGVTKTTTTANLGGILADLGASVLFVDLDPQSTLSSYYNVTKRADLGVLSVVQTGVIDGAISSVDLTEGLTADLIVSDDVDNKLHDWIRDTPDGRTRLKRAVEKAPYDVVLIDTPGLSGPLQDTGVLAADFMISPIVPDILSAREFGRGTIQMLERLQPMASLGCPPGQLYGLIARKDQTKNARIIAESLSTASFAGSKGKIRILETTIPSKVCYNEAATLQIPVHLHDAKSQTSTPSARETMLELVKELFPNYARGSLQTDEGRANGQGASNVVKVRG